MHPGDDMLWETSHPEEKYWNLDDGRRVGLAGTERFRSFTRHGTRPGRWAYRCPKADVLFSGDTLFNGGPGATGRSYSDFPTVTDSIRGHLFALPDETRVPGGTDTVNDGDRLRGLEQMGVSVRRVGSRN